MTCLSTTPSPKTCPLTVVRDGDDANLVAVDVLDQSLGGVANWGVSVGAVTQSECFWERGQEADGLIERSVEFDASLFAVPDVPGERGLIFREGDRAKRNITHRLTVHTPRGTFRVPLPTG